MNTFGTLMKSSRQNTKIYFRGWGETSEETLGATKKSIKAHELWLRLKMHSTKKLRFIKQIPTQAN